MKRRVIKLFGIFAVLFLVANSLSSWTNNTVKYNKPDANYTATVTPEQKSKFNFLTIGKSFVAFKEALAFKESKGKYNRVNIYGYLGKYQFGKSTLKRFKIYDTAEFLKNPELQEDAFVALCSVNKWILQRDIKRFKGKKINGVEVTESGILAAAHLAGAGNVKKYLRSYGAFKFEDAFGTTIHYYLKKFAGYDTSLIEANRMPKII
ncbi:MAG: peptidoglycan-binding protein LysM [Flavobacteriales bacterium]|nr:MAG: peptidoglycan-binding protein LysM [Flavobacteriales bacterium]